MKKGICMIIICFLSVFVVGCESKDKEVVETEDKTIQQVYDLEVSVKPSPHINQSKFMR